MTKVVELYPEPPTPDECLENMKGRLEEVMILGVKEDSTIILNGNMDVPESLLLIAMGYKILLDGAMGYDDDDAIH